MARILPIVMNNLLYTSFLPKRLRIDMEWSRKPFRPLEWKDPYHGGHRFHPYGRHDRPWFMVNVRAHARGLAGMRRVSTYLGR